LGLLDLPVYLVEEIARNGHSMKILSTQQMNEVDRLTEVEFGIPTLLLMENAGSSLHSTLESYFEDLESELIAIVCGKGNNGGDGIVLARHLTQLQIYPDVYLLGKVEEVSGDATPRACFR